MARRMDIGVDSRVEMIFVDDNGEVRRDRFAVSGLYSTGVEMIDAAVLLTDMRNVQRLCDWPQEHITGYGATTPIAPSLSPTRSTRLLRSYTSTRASMPRPFRSRRYIPRYSAGWPRTTSTPPS